MKKTHSITTMFTLPPSPSTNSTKKFNVLPLSSLEIQHTYKPDTNKHNTLTANSEDKVQFSSMYIHKPNLWLLTHTRSHTLSLSPRVNSLLSAPNQLAAIVAHIHTHTYLSLSLCLSLFLSLCLSLALSLSFSLILYIHRNTPGVWRNIQEKRERERESERKTGRERQRERERETVEQTRSMARHTRGQIWG